jgi:hypothetical protein
MTTAADNDGLHDQAADYDREGQEWAVRDRRESGVVMMAATKMAAAEDSGGGRQQWQWWQSMAVDNNSIQDWVADYDGEG